MPRSDEMDSRPPHIWKRRKIWGNKEGKYMMMIYKFHKGPILYSLTAFGVEEASVGKKLNTCPLTEFQMFRGEYPIGMGFIFIESSTTLYMVGGQFKKNGSLYSSKKVFSLDLTSFFDSSGFLSVQEASSMNAGKSNPIVVNAAGKIYVLSSGLDGKCDPNTEHLGPVNGFEVSDGDIPHPPPINILEEDPHPPQMFEVFDPQSGIWTVLPNPPNYNLWWFPTIIIGHVVMHDRIILNSVDLSMFIFDINRQEWEYSYFPYIVKEPKDFDSTLVHLFFKFGFPGRGCIVEDYNTLITFEARCDVLYAYSIPDCKDTTSFPHGAVKNLEIDHFGHMYESTGGLSVGAELVHFGRGIFGIIARDDDEQFLVKYGSKSIEETPKRDITVTIAHVVQNKSASGETQWFAETVNKDVFQNFDARFGTFIYCFALDGTIC